MLLHLCPSGCCFCALASVATVAFAAGLEPVVVEEVLLAVVHTCLSTEVLLLEQDNSWWEHEVCRSCSGSTRGRGGRPTYRCYNTLHVKPLKGPHPLVVVKLWSETDDLQHKPGLVLVPSRQGWGAREE